MASPRRCHVLVHYVGVSTISSTGTLGYGDAVPSENIGDCGASRGLRIPCAWCLATRLGHRKLPLAVSGERRLNLKSGSCPAATRTLVSSSDRTAVLLSRLEVTSDSAVTDARERDDDEVHLDMS